MGGWMQKAIVEEWETHREGQTHSGHNTPTQHPHSHPTPSSLSLCGRQRRPFPARRAPVCAPTRSHARTHPVPWLLPAALFCVCRHRQREWPRCRWRALWRKALCAKIHPRRGPSLSRALLGTRARCGGRRWVHRARGRTGRQRRGAGDAAGGAATRGRGRPGRVAPRPARGRGGRGLGASGRHR